MTTDMYSDPCLSINQDLIEDEANMNSATGDMW